MHFDYDVNSKDKVENVVLIFAQCLDNIETAVHLIIAP